HALVALQHCPVLVPAVGTRLPELAGLLSGLPLAPALQELEVSVGDDLTVLVLRHAGTPTAGDHARLQAFGAATGMQLALQSQAERQAGSAPAVARPRYRLPGFELELAFDPTGFVQVNAAVNDALVGRVVSLLDAGPQAQVLDLYCGTGNFTLPLARRAGAVHGLEGAPALVELARANATANRVANCTFQVADLEDAPEPLGRGAPAFTHAVVDPPRQGAAACLPWLARQPLQRLVYVSCDPATLARDAGSLVKQHGFALAAAGLVDMFPHTAHVEALALFTRRAGRGSAAR
ncbi:MAG TPA: methyltransferase domain-containing protein, partial [Gammaproteobacteria bacterium]